MPKNQLIKNTFLHGFIVGIIVPIVVFGLLFAVNRVLITTDTEFPISFKLSSIALFSICANLIPVLYANRLYMEEFIRGIMIPTVLAAFVWFFYFDPIGLFN